jgi:amino acid adenylation domain-containing protein
VVSDAPRTVLPRWAPPQGGRAVRLHFVPIPAERADGLRRLAQRAGVPVKSVLLAAHLRVLSLLSGDPDVMTGLVSNGRPEEEGGERVLGLFLNTLPVRARLEGGTWIDLVRQVFAAERDQLPYRRFPLAEVQRMAGGQMLFETVFNFVHFHVYESIGGLRGLDVLAGGGFEEANYPFAANFSLAGTAGPIEMRFDYDATEFGEEAIRTIAGYYERTLSRLAEDPEARYEIPAPFGDEERLRLLAAGEGEEAPLPGRGDLVHERLSSLAALQPSALAVVGEEENLTFADLEGRANRLAHRLVHLGAGPETRVGVCLRRTPELLVAFFGALKTGAAYVPFDPDYPRERLAALLADARPAVLVTEEAVAGRLPEVDLPTLLLDRDREAIAAEPAEAPSGGVAPESAAYVVYTSGSTGASKGVVVPHGALANFSRGIAGALGLGPGHRVLQFASPAFDASALQIYPTLTSGAAVVIHPDPAGLTGQEILDLCMRQGITLLDLPGALWRQWVAEMATRGEALPPGITLYLTGGERLSAETLRQWAGVVPADALFLSSYGPTEATVTTTVFMLRAGDVASWTPSPAPLGRALPNTRILLLDLHGEPAPVGVPGELYIGGAGLARGYLGRPDLTAERFVPAPGSRPGERFYRTGDLGRRTPGGGLEFLGRTDHQVKIRGYRVEPAEVEAALARHPAVQETVVLAREERPGDRRLVAWVTPRPEAVLSVPELRQHVASVLPEFMIPSAFVLLAEMPLLPSGKVDRRALPAPDGTQVPRSAPYQAPRTPAEQVVAEIWSQVLGVETIGVFDSFFELGGHSLMATQVITRVREAFEIDLHLRNVFESPTIAGLAEAILADPERRQRVERTAALRVQLAALSDEEVEALLEAEDAGGPRG